MAKFTKDEFINGLKEMTILEVKELVDAMKEEFGVDPSAVAVAAAPGAAADAGEDANAAKTVVLKDAGATKIAVIKILKEVTGLGLVEAKALADNGGNVKENVPAEEANAIKAQLEEAGATVELA
ncbi:MAG: 50S ribosomal protein L7/L12 [Bacilli bacterium]